MSMYDYTRAPFFDVDVPTRSISANLGSTYVVILYSYFILFFYYYYYLIRIIRLFAEYDHQPHPSCLGQPGRHLVLANQAILMGELAPILGEPAPVLAIPATSSRSPVCC